MLALGFPVPGWGSWWSSSSDSQDDFQFAKRGHECMFITTIMTTMTTIMEELGSLLGAVLAGGLATIGAYLGTMAVAVRARAKHSGSILSARFNLFPEQSNS